MSAPSAPTRDLRFAIVTPSFYEDYERCLLLVDSVRRYLPATMHHFIIVAKDDLELFRSTAGPRTHILVQEDLIPDDFLRVPFSRKWRVSWRTLPIRGWIWQQMVKLSIASRIDADAYMIMDSDCFFVRPFDPHTLIKDGRVPMFREEKDFYRTSSDSQKWSEVARRLLRLPAWREPYGVGYVGPGSFWRRDVLLKLRDYVSNGRGANDWLYRIARNLTFSEYMLYGVYVDQVLGLAASGHYAFDLHICHEYWGTTPMSSAETADFARKLPEEHYLAMINARSDTPLSDIRAAFGFGPHQT